jgi:hypothetical protein
MIFLPATFVAAIVSMNFFDLTTSPPKVSSYIWIFWLVALGLTAVVLAVYFFWKWKTKMKMDEEKKEIERREREVGWWGAPGGDGAVNSGYGSGSDAESGRKKRRRRRRSGRYDSGDDGQGKAGKKSKEKPELAL